MEFPQGQPYEGAPFPDVEWGEKNAILTLPASGQIAYGEVVCRDITQLSGFNTWSGLASGVAAPAGYPQQPDMVVPANNAAAGLVYGIFKFAPSQAYPFSTTVTGENGTAGAPTNLSGLHNTGSTALQIPIQVRFYGYTTAWCKALATGSSGVTINNGTILVDNPTNSNMLVGSASFVGHKTCGTALATVISGTLTSGVGSALITAGTATTYALLNVDLRLE